MVLVRRWMHEVMRSGEVPGKGQSDSNRCTTRKRRPAPRGSRPADLPRAGTVPQQAGASVSM